MAWLFVVTLSLTLITLSLPPSLSCAFNHAGGTGEMDSRWNSRIHHKEGTAEAPPSMGGSKASTPPLPSEARGSQRESPAATQPGTWVTPGGPPCARFRVRVSPLYGSRREAARNSLADEGRTRLGATGLSVALPRRRRQTTKSVSRSVVPTRRKGFCVNTVTRRRTH